MPEPNQLIGGRYRLIEHVGTGAHGTVWKAQDERLARPVAVKVVDVPATQRDPGIVARFRREAQTAAGLSTAHVVAIYDSGEDGSLLYLVMELLSGPSLGTLIHAKGRLTLAEGLPLAEQVASGLVLAHASGIVHRDLKPANVVLGNGTAKIVDFGIARFTDTPDATMTSAATVSGTAAYMSPEQAAGQSVHAPSDMYAFGCLLWTMFVGVPPFPGDNAVAVASAQVNKAPPPFAAACPDCPVALANLIDQLLAKDPAARPTAAQAQQQLGTLVGGTSFATVDREPSAVRTAVLPAVPPTAPPPPPPLVTTRRRSGRRGSAARWLLTALLAIVVVLLGWWLQSRALNPSRTPTPTVSASSATSRPTLSTTSTSTTTTTRSTTSTTTTTTTAPTSTTPSPASPTTPAASATAP